MPNENFTGYVVIAVVVALILVMVYRGHEAYTVRTVDMTAYFHPDPIAFKYTGRIRNPMGMDGYDYFYENDMYHRELTGPEMHGVPAFQPQVPIRMPSTEKRALRGLERGPFIFNQWPSTEIPKSEAVVEDDRLETFVGCC